MKIVKYICFTIFLALILLIPVTVHASSDYYKDIVVHFSECEGESNGEVTIQLFADGKKVEGEEFVLNRNNGYSHTFEHLQVFMPESPNEIRYEVKYLEDGVYKLISPKNYTYETKTIDKWVQILPEDIKPGHTYVITTDNWNYENNGFSKIIYLRGDITAKGAQVVPEYNIIDGKQSYYVLDGEPIENTKWTVSSVPTDDPDYNTFKDYLVFTNEGGKKLTLTGYNNSGNINFIFKYSSKNGYVESEDAMYTNKVTLTYVPGSKGRFYIGTKNLYPEPNNKMQYITLSGQNQYQAGSVMERAAQFKAFEHVNKEVKTGEIELLEESLCKKDYVVIDKNTDYKRSIDVSFDCNDCDSRKGEDVTLQLFANNIKVDGEEVTLNDKVGYDHIFTSLPVFDESMKEIKYDVRVLKNNQYVSLPTSYSNFETETVNKWRQVLPKDIKEGNTYLLVTENLNYKSNGFSRYIYLRGDVTAKGSNIITEYNIINGDKYYYSFLGEPIENTKWTVSKVPTDDPDYNTFKDYLMFTNEGGKKLTLTGYNNGGDINFIYKYSGKNGYVESEDAMYTNKVAIIPTNDIFGSFYIATKNLYPEPNNMLQYISLSSQNQYQASDNINNATKFMAFEYGTEEIVVASKMEIHPTLCELLNFVDSAVLVPDTNKNINLLEIVTIITMSLLLMTGVIIHKRFSKQR